MFSFKLILSLASISLIYTADVVIHKNEMPDDMRLNAIRIASDEIDAKHDDLTVAKSLKQKFDQAYGPYWICFVAESYAFDLTPKSNTYLYFSRGNKAVVLFKSAEEGEKQIVADLRKLKVSNISIEFNYMNTTMKDQAITTTLLAISSFDGFFEVAQNISLTFDSVYGKYWQAFIGPDKSSYSYFRYSPKDFISIILSGTRVQIYKAPC